MKREVDLLVPPGDAQGRAWGAIWTAFSWEPKEERSREEWAIGDGCYSLSLCRFLASYRFRSTSRNASSPATIQVVAAGTYRLNEPTIVVNLPEQP